MDNQNQTINPTPNTPAIPSAPPRIAILKNTLNAESVQEQFRNALKENSGAFIASIIDLYNNDNQLQECNPNQVVNEALKAAIMKLPINKALGFAYIIVFKNRVIQPDGSDALVPTPTFVPGYKGYIQLAMRTGQYKNLNADFVYEGELRRVNKLSGEIAFDGERTSDKIVGYFCYFELLNGFSKTLYMTIEEMGAYAKKNAPSLKFNAKITKESLTAKANDTYSSGAVGWNGNYNDMALKTVTRRLLSKYGYLSIEMQGAISSEIIQNNASNQIEQKPTPNTPSAVNIEDIQCEEVTSQAPIEEDGPGY